MKRKIIWNVLLGAGLALATAAAFAGYMRPDMLVEFANLMLCGPAL